MPTNLHNQTTRAVFDDSFDESTLKAFGQNGGGTLDLIANDQGAAYSLHFQRRSHASNDAQWVIEVIKQERELHEQQQTQAEALAQLMAKNFSQSFELLESYYQEWLQAK
ncbi:hypothetical protein [Agaribacterium sp. ZY112]|uniref:hypothetical protein n=1 Tax=Agaribacterium sp. ZY112 TaxID=3233574 RepID=UPI0035254E35